jgi:hypothetical protein
MRNFAFESWVISFHTTLTLPESPTMTTRSPMVSPTYRWVVIKVFRSL